MKKLVVLCLTVGLCLCCLASCFEALRSEECVHTKGNWEHDETGHWQPYVCSLNKCDLEPSVKVDHIDKDKNDICDVCDYHIPEHEHTYQNYQDEFGHGWSYTCGCMTPPNFALHFDGNSDGKCDDCTYQMVAEGNHFIRNQTGAEWLCEITAEDIAEIKMISGGGGPLPPVSKTHISSSINDAVISSIFEEYYWLDSKPVSEESTQIADGGYFIVQFILNNGETKQLYFINGDFYHDGNGNYFEIVRLPVFRDGTDFVTRYGFERQYNPYQIHLIDGTPVCEIPFSEFEFTELTDDICLDAELPTHYFELHGERVYFIKGEYFYIGDSRSVYYQLLGNLDELIAEYNEEICEHIWDDGIEIESGTGAYLMEYTCTVCGKKDQQIITIIPEESTTEAKNGLYRDTENTIFCVIYNDTITVSKKTGASAVSASSIVSQTYTFILENGYYNGENEISFKLNGDNLNLKLDGKTYSLSLDRGASFNDKIVKISKPSNVDAEASQVYWYWHINEFDNPYETGILSACLEIISTENELINRELINYIPKPASMFHYDLKNMKLAPGEYKLSVKYIGGLYVMNNTIYQSLDSDAVIFLVTVTEDNNYIISPEN